MKHLFDKYYITQFGDIISTRNGKFKVLNQPITKSGYKRINLSVNGVPKKYFVHRLVAAAFYGESSLTVDHIDGNKINNHISNLQYMSKIDNFMKAVKEGRIPKSYNHPKCNLSKDQVLIIRNSLKSKRSLAKEFNVSRRTIKRIKENISYKE